MKGLKENTQEVFELLSQQEWIREYTLIGGTALALQIHHRISEDLDFCVWQSPSIKGRLLVKRDEITNHLTRMGLNFEVTRLLDNQIDLVANEVKITFFADSQNQKPNQDNRPKHFAYLGSSFGLKQKNCGNDHQGYQQDIRLKKRRYNFETFDRTQYGDCWRYYSVAIQKHSANQT